MNVERLRQMQDIIMAAGREGRLIMGTFWSVDSKPQQQLGCSVGQLCAGLYGSRLDRPIALHAIEKITEELGGRNRRRMIETTQDDMLADGVDQETVAKAVCRLLYAVELED